jgi:hypothetical protein
VWEEERKRSNVEGRQQNGKNDARSLAPTFTCRREARRDDVLLPSPHLTLILLHNPHESGAGAAFQAPPNWPCHPVHLSRHSRPRLALSFPFPPSVTGKKTRQAAQAGGVQACKRGLPTPEAS